MIVIIFWCHFHLLVSCVVIDVYALTLLLLTLIDIISIDLVRNRLRVGGTLIVFLNNYICNL